MSKYPELDAYIKEARANGVSRKDLKAQMIAAGYDEKDVGSALSRVPFKDVPMRFTFVLMVIIGIITFDIAEFFAPFALVFTLPAAALGGFAIDISIYQVRRGKVIGLVLGLLLVVAAIISTLRAYKSHIDNVSDALAHVYGDTVALIPLAFALGVLVGYAIDKLIDRMRGK